MSAPLPTGGPPPAGTPPPRPPSPVRGSRIVVAGVVGGGAFLAISQFLLAIIATTTVRLSSYTAFWGTLLLGAFGLVAGMAVEAVRQLQAANPDPEYHRPGGVRPRGRGS